MHPSHNNGAGGGKFDGGAHTDFAGVPIPPRDTEWPIATLLPHTDLPIVTDLTAWFSAGQLTVGNRWHLARGEPAMGAMQYTFARQQSFAFAVIMDNPAPATAYSTPRVIGPPTSAISVAWNVADNGFRIAINSRMPTGRRLVP